MATDGNYNQALASFSRKQIVAVSMTMEEWLKVPPDVRMGCFFMAGVSDRKILERFHLATHQVIANEKDINTADKELSMWLDEYGYRCPEGKLGTFDDLSSIERIGFELRSNTMMAAGHAHWVRSQVGIRIYPAQRFIRISERMEPRDWETRWALAKAETANVPGVHPTEKVALLNHPIWVALSVFGYPWPPFDFGSGMGEGQTSLRDQLEALRGKWSALVEP